ncbi:MAG: hypothetical protein AAFY71_18800 [Bacteroidota bacterium]
MQLFTSFPSEDGNQSPFLGYQAHSLRLRQQQPFSTEGKGKENLLYQKPVDICKPVGSGIESVWKLRNPFDFSMAWRKKIERYLASYKLIVRKMTRLDTPAILEFIKKRYPEKHQHEICAFDLHRWGEYGHGLVLVDQEGVIHGHVFEVGYLKNRTSYTIRLAVSQDLAGYGLGYQLILYSSLLAMEEGAVVKRGIIQCKNHKSLYINLNRVGWICDGYEAHDSEMEEFFHIALPLNPFSLIANEFDVERAKIYLERKREGLHYQLIPAIDLKAIRYTFEHTHFKIAGFFKPGELKKEAMLLALSQRELSYQTE